MKREYRHYVIKFEISVKNKNNFLLSKTFHFFLKQKYIFFYSWKSIFFRFLRIRLEILKNSNKSLNVLLTAKVNFKCWISPGMRTKEAFFNRKSVEEKFVLYKNKMFKVIRFFFRLFSLLSFHHIWFSASFLHSFQCQFSASFLSVLPGLFWLLR